MDDKMADTKANNMFKLKIDSNFFGNGCYPR